MSVRLTNLFSRLSVRLMAFNLLLVFLPATGLLFFDDFERQLLNAQERAMVQQGRLLAAALSGHGRLTSDWANPILVRLNQRQEARLRVFNPAGKVLADSSRLGPRRQQPDPAAENIADDPTASEPPLYRLGSWFFRLYRQVVPEDGKSTGAADGEGFSLPAVHAALAGRYGADTRVAAGETPGLILYSAIPVTSDGEVVGAVLVSQSTRRILAALYQVRLGIFRIFLAAVAAAVVLSLIVATTIVRPLHRLRREARGIVDRRGRLRGLIRGLSRRDEIGDLSRALEELTRRLEAHLRFTESFASDVSHQFKNPLTSIRTAAELLSEEDDPAHRRRFEDIILGEIQRLEHLLSGVREISRLDAEIDGEAPRRVDLPKILEGVVEAARLRAREAAAPALELCVRAAGATVTGSPQALAHAYENLLDNAAGFSPRGGTVKVSLGTDGGEAVVTVDDQGPGLPEEHLEKIFDRFFTYRPGQPTRGARHSGLGLAIARATFDLHGGTIRAENRPEGGARIEVRLPLAEG